MASTISLRLLLAIIVGLSLTFVATAQQLVAVTDPSNGGPQYDLDIPTVMNDQIFNLDPLTDASSITKSTLAGTLVLTTPSNANTLLRSAIAYISCDDSAYENSNIKAKDVFTIVLDRPSPVAIVLYSINATRCTLSPNDNRDSPIYSMKDNISAAKVRTILGNSSTILGNSTIKAHDSDGNGGGGILGKSPTTAVAMIILYSITGLITALFLVIIVVGAIRAHRHPERYGPRNVIGRPRQSRAKGLARAMLETLPIVKFGGNEDPKAANPQRDIEMAPPHAVPEAPQQSQSPIETEGPSSQALPNGESNSGTAPNPSADTSIPPQPTDDPTANADNGLACSVCTDDFAKGQDVRVLPCNHKFHPECIDPWLLNVSGTCPLCRVDLRPTASNDNDPDTAADQAAPPRRHSDALTSFAAAPQNQSRRSSRARPLHYLHHYLNRGRMEEATPQERLEALRRLRLVNHEDVDHAAEPDGGESSVAGEGRHRNRLSVRLSRAFGGDRSRPVSWVTSTRAETPAVPEAEDETAASGARAGEGRRASAVERGG
ncbi:MAG: hypothetical protein Q9201_007263 [Fulgogasparrea decipioides]